MKLQLQIINLYLISKYKIEYFTECFILIFKNKTNIDNNKISQIKVTEYKISMINIHSGLVNRLYLLEIFTFHC